MKISKLRKMILKKDYFSNRIIQFSQRIDYLNNLSDYRYQDSNGNWIYKRGNEENKNVSILNNKEIKILKNKIDYYKNKLNLK